MKEGSGDWANVALDEEKEEDAKSMRNTAETSVDDDGDGNEGMQWFRAKTHTRTPLLRGQLCQDLATIPS